MTQTAGLSAASRANIAVLSDIQAQMNAAQRHLSTGKRVNDPTDNPLAFFTSAALKNRASDLGTLLDNMTTAQSTITAANKAITAIQSLLTSAQNYANQALASTQSLVTVTGNNSAALSTSTLIASTGGNASKFKAGDTITVNDGTTTATYTAANNDTVQTILNAINGASGLKATASLNSSGQIQIAATSNVNITIGGSVNGAGGGTLNGIVGLTAGTTNYTTNTTRQSMAAQFDALRTQIDAAVSDATYNGVNLLSGGSLSVLFNETGSSKLTMTGSTLTTAAMGLTASTNSFQLDTDINAALTKITTALNAVTSASASFGTYQTVMDVRTDFNKGLIDALNSGADGLVAADPNEEGAALLLLQTRQQLATTALTLAHGQDSNVLRLFGLNPS